MLEAETISSNYKKHLKIVDAYIKGERKQKVIDLIEKLGEEYIMAPASSKSWHHNAFPGGYIDHVNRVVEYAVKQMRLYEEMGGLIDFTVEELVFAALFHDLGKIGDGDKSNYLPQTDKWRRDKLKEMYSFNPELEFMLIPDRSLFILQKFGIKISKKEWFGIRLHDGVFDKANEAYFFSHQDSSRMKTNIVYILHTADFLASKQEYDNWKAQGNTAKPKVVKTQTSNNKTVNSSEGLANMLKNI
tara:strand:+ start:6959 stop:7693 length:735 start_codon:yes stop_codon:yes gene_type:complete